MQLRCYPALIYAHDALFASIHWQLRDEIESLRSRLEISERELGQRVQQVEESEHVAR